MPKNLYDDDLANALRNIATSAQLAIRYLQRTHPSRTLDPTCCTPRISVTPSLTPRIRQSAELVKMSSRTPRSAREYVTTSVQVPRGASLKAKVPLSPLISMTSEEARRIRSRTPQGTPRCYHGSRVACRSVFDSLLAAVLSCDFNRFEALIAAPFGREALLLKNDDGFTPLHIASMKGLGKMVALIASLVSPDMRGKHNLRALHMAAYSGKAEAVELLITAKADVACVDICGFTALHFAAKKGFRIVCDSLIRAYPAALRIREQHGRLPLDLAVENGHNTLIPLLSGKGAVFHSASTSASATPTIKMTPKTNSPYNFRSISPYAQRSKTFQRR